MRDTLRPGVERFAAELAAEAAEHEFDVDRAILAIGGEDEEGVEVGFELQPGECFRLIEADAVDVLDELFKGRSGEA